MLLQYGDSLQYKLLTPSGDLDPDSEGRLMISGPHALRSPLSDSYIADVVLVKTRWDCSRLLQTETFQTLVIALERVLLTDTVKWSRLGKYLDGIVGFYQILSTSCYKPVTKY